MQGKDTCSPEAISNPSELYKTMQLLPAAHFPLCVDMLQIRWNT
jgi:hypothetical protein